MKNSSSAGQLVVEEQQRIDSAESRLERRGWLNSVAVVIALIALTLTVATILAKLGGDLTIRL